ncbi:zinc finger protein CONSTANS-LIKE 12 isoform X2 [Arabidopsis lyrata subsp. lyrata]|nr:zinc finger protein CONSTANS-LIKE 12 isoform X2 [Arabidopsis lyrata subsp. lyrata]|eukprot:XP_002883322.2 zinc finger protein CONSTANS-LIKE 12 isoform X2 [Arabidopsis lyrata subsp. lyrata]
MCPSMEPKCDHCATSQAVIYCKSDLAKLCQNCDFHVHSANPLSHRHSRSLICQKCFSQPAVIRCLGEKVSYCQRCHWHASNCSDLGHRVQRLNPFSGCPSPTDFVKMWSSILEPSVSSLVSPFVGSLPLNDPNNTMFGMAKINELDGLIGSPYSMVPHSFNVTQNFSDQLSFFSVESKGYPDLVLKLEEGEEDLCEGLNFDNAPLNFDVGDDIIGCSLEEPIEPDHTVPNCLLIDKNNTSVTASNFTIDNTSASSPGQQMNINTGLPLPLSPVLFGQIHPSLNISNVTGESNAADYQDCGMPPGFITSEAPWESNLEVSCPQARTQAKLRYMEKKLKRSFGKQIRYASRKARADTRKRVKGRFVKAGDNYDYDPSSPTTNN